MNKPGRENRMLLPGRRCGSVRIPSSKSAAHRILICAALGSRPVAVRLNGLSQDILATANCLRALGAGVEQSDRELRIQPLDRSPDLREVLLPAGESGSTLRFLLPLIGALGRKAVFQMEGRLSRRPLAPLDAVLREHGMSIEQDGDRLLCSGQLQSGDYALAGNVSSQYFSGLLMALPLLEGSSTLSAGGKLESAGYVRMTEQVLESSGIAVERQPGLRWIIPGGQRPQLPETVPVEGDWSNAAFFLCMGALSERGVRVDGLRHDSAHGDRAVLSLLQDFGAITTIGSGEESSGGYDSVTVCRGDFLPMCIDASDVPDLIPALAVLCCAAEGRSEITNASRLRLKESDRLQTTAELIRSLGGEVLEHPDGLTVCGTGKLKGGTADAHNDHRIAMSAALAACLCGEPVELIDAGCVRKSYPAFWTDYESLERSTK